ncbi:MAG: AAA family ATPase [Methylobacter sp.]
MIRKLQINNYKSLHELTLDVGRFNVLIGENGCGKSNLLEAIALVAAAASNKLDHEFLSSRGIRVTEPQLMRSAFCVESVQEPIKIEVGFENLDKTEMYSLTNDNQPYTKWARLEAKISKETIMPIRGLINKIIEEEVALNIEKLVFAEDEDEDEKKIKAEITKKIIDGIYKSYGADAKNHIEYFKNITDNEDKLKKFIIYSPENTALRNFYKEGQIEPLGINGEGLLKLLKVIQSKSPEQRQDIHTSLQLFDWYAELEIPRDLSQSEDKVTITDRYLTMAFDQRSANEGFLFVLFYIALMVSDDTPKIFAIDNIDTSLNPKLCTKLVKELVRLAKKYDKQVFVTTHNPAILDGIDLGDDEQRLLVVSRNKQGHTRYKRITLEDKPRSSTNEDLKLSEAFLRGYLGGLPKGF